MPPKKKAKTETPAQEKLIHNDPALSKFPPAFRQVLETLKLAPDYDYVLYFAEKNPAPGDARKSGMMCTLVPMVDQPDGSVKPMRASLGMMLDFMMAVERMDIPGTRTTDVIEFNDEMPKHKM